MSVSHPGSPKFGKHWTVEDVHNKFAPQDKAISDIRTWLMESGIQPDAILHSQNKGFIAIDLPAWQAQELFKTSYHEYEHQAKTAETGMVKVGCDEYHVPARIAHHIDYITPGVALSPKLTKSKIKNKREWNGPPGPGGSGYGHHPRPGPIQQPPHWNPHWQPPPGSGSLPPDLQACGTNITQACLRYLYKIPQATKSDSVNMMGVYETGDKYAQEDLDLYFAKFAPNVPQGTHPKLDSVDGGMAPVAPGDANNTGESLLDIDLAYTFIYPQTVTLYQVDDNYYGLADGFNNFLDALDGSYCTYSAYGVSGNTAPYDSVYPDPQPGGYKGNVMCGAYTPTKVISVSYGEAESDMPPNYTRRQCNEYAKLALQGITILFASGDYGVASFPGDPSDNGCLGDNQDIFNPQYPSCPYVTSVGATMLYPYQTVNDRESVLQRELQLNTTTNFGSSGGFANYFPVPSYQKSAVATYFANHDPGYKTYIANYNATNIGENGGRYNRAGRGFPDVSANGNNLLYFRNLTERQVHGTSLAAPIWGALITLINEERYAVGKGSVGFINPTLYENPSALNDIVNGTNQNCNSNGFSAVEGWDPATGLGTPNYEKLLEIFMKLP